MKRFYTRLIVVFFMVMLAIPASAQAIELMSSEGEVMDIGSAEAEAVNSVSAFFKGSGGTNKEALAAEGVESLAAPMGELMAAKPMTAGIGIENVLGFDSRVQTYTNGFPRKAVGLITFSPPGGSSRCTGWLIGKNTVATAGHCVAQGGSGKFYPPSSYRFYAGKNGSSSPYGSCTAKTLYTNTTWISQAKDDYDWGLIKLNCTVGNTVGWFGFFSTTNSLLNEPTVISGYPGDKPLTQWESIDKVRVNQPKRLFYKNDTYGGMSGSPVWADRPPGAPFAQNGAYAMGVHAYGIYNGAPFSTHNHGTRIDKSVFDAFVYVKNLP